ncbi:MAG: glycosyl transferase family protein [Gammaproteobacteria bacterium]|nr:glycosyl transferase family protein [Gammaproteobacteria bacterium]
MTQPTQEHPFAPYIRILGKGRKGSRGLSYDEMQDAMRMIMQEDVEPIQLGAFLMLMRVKEESAEEVAAAVSVIRETLEFPDDLPTVDLDWSSYAGKKRILPWFLLSCLNLAEHGIRTFMHGASGHTEGRIYSKDILPQLGIPVATSLTEAASQIAQSNFSYIDLEHLSPKLHEIIEMRPLLGLRSPVHTIARMLNPFAADYMMQGIFHPGYRPTHQEAALLLNQPHMVVFKGEGGEIERNPDQAVLLQAVHQGEMSEEEWPAMFSKRHTREDEMDVNQLKQIWRGEREDEYAEAAVIGTMAITLYMMGRADDRSSAEAMARTMWRARDRQRI